MALECMRDEMLRQIKKRSGSEAQVIAYRAAWNDAMVNSEKPLPCPSCFIEGNIHRLKSISEERSTGVVRCEHCRATFEFDSPETR